MPLSVAKVVLATQVLNKVNILRWLNVFPLNIKEHKSRWLTRKEDGIATPSLYLRRSVFVSREKSMNYLALSASRISVNNTSSVEGFGSAFGATSSTFFIEFIALTIMKITNAIMTKSTTV